MASPAINRAPTPSISTGPRSVEGKAVSRFNAMKHGLGRRFPRHPRRRPCRARPTCRRFSPRVLTQGPIETELVEILVRSTWLRHRYVRVEAGVYETIFKKFDDPDATMATLVHYDASGNQFFRKKNAATRDFNRALIDLRRLQEARAEMEMLKRGLSPAAPPASPPAPLPGRAVASFRNPSRFASEFAPKSNPNPSTAAGL